MRETARGSAAALRASVLAGILYDWVAAILILSMSPSILSLMGLPMPPEPFHFRFAGLLLVILPFFYLLPWRDPIRYSGVVGMMIVARLCGFAYLALYGGARGVPFTYVLFGLIDLVFAIAHFSLARRAGITTKQLYPLFDSR